MTDMKMILAGAVLCAFASLPAADAGGSSAAPWKDRADILANVNDGWNWMMGTWHPKTGLIYGCPVERVEPAKNFRDGLLVWKDGKVNFGRGMGDCAIVSGVALSMLCDKHAVTRDASVGEDAKKIAFGLLNLARSHGRKGFVARGLCAEDGASISRISSRDQVTHWVHGLLRYCRQDWADARTKEDFKKLVVEVAERMLRNVTPENGYNFLMADGEIDPRGICTMWGDAIRPHEAARLPMIYLAAWRMSGDAKWKALYEKYVDEALDRTLAIRDKPMREWEGCMPTYALFQLNTSLEVVLELERDPARIARVRDAMDYTAKMADVRLVNLLTKKRKSYYGLCVPGELALAILMSPDSAFSPDDEAYLMQALEKPLARSGAFDATHLAAAYWRARANAAAANGVVSFKDADRIRSWDAWDDHKKKAEARSIFEKEKRCVTWEKIRKLDCGLPPAGMLETRLARDIKGSKWSIGCETMDRDYADWNAYKEYLPHLGAKRGRLFSGWAKTEQEKGKYDFSWLDPQVREMAAMGVKPWICLSYGNPVWGSDFRLGMRVKQVTGNPEAFEAWLRYCTACVERYKDAVDEWEIWNEPFDQAPEYAELFYRTAKAVRAVQPDAKCFVTAVSWNGKEPLKSDYGVVLERLKKENALDLASFFMYHPYTPNPDTSYAGFAEPLRALVKSYSPTFDIYQGEVGCPSQLEYAHALDRIEWTEYSQAKWLLRRTMGDAVRNIRSSVFTCVDLRYTFMLQSFGLLRCSLLKEVVYRRPSFHAMQHVFSYFDDDVHPVGVTKRTVNGKELTVAEFERHSSPVYVLWFSGERPGDALAYETCDVTVDRTLLYDFVWVDLLTGKIRAIPEANVVREKGRTGLKGLPLWDSPVMIAANSQVPRKTEWEKMKPAEIVDALYRPHQAFKGWVGDKLPIKMDVSNEPWTKMKTADFLPCFDKYGQFKWRDWPGKTHSDEELRASVAAEEADLAAHPGPADRSRFGGWTKGPKETATGRFYPKKIDGKWWLVDPEGHLFWSWGPVRVTPSSALTPLNGNPRTPKCGGAMPDRDCLFTDLPKKGEPLARFYGTYDALLLPFYLKRDETRRFDFSAANLYRKYGEDWFEKFADSCHRRLRSWGANTIANSSDLRICLQDRTPYAERVEVASRPIAGSWGSWFKFRDPFDPSFRTATLAALAEHGREAHDPWCIGFFIDNEIQWGSRHEDLARWTLRSPDDQPAKIAFVKRLAAKGIVWDGDVNKVPDSELRAFTDVLVAEYFKRTRDALREFDKGLLYLGCRFAGSVRPWVIGPCAKYCDVVSYNIYDMGVEKWRLPQNLDAPVLIGEFHFGAHDRGLFGSGLVNAGTQAGRAAALKAYVESGLKNPQIVGVHWHQFSDQATSGRFDGEHFQVGWTDVCDKPYPETVKALREVGYPMYETRAAAK